MQNDITKKYTNGEITIVWKPGVCIHSTLCWKGLGEVFNPTQRPWVNMDAATTTAIIEQVNKCPSGALSYVMNNELKKETTYNEETTIEVSKNGPYIVKGKLKLNTPNGETHELNNTIALCRCGASANKPFCDGSHRKVDFKDE